MSFREYVSKRKPGPNAAGDFVRDARMANDLPDATSWAELHNYLENRNACFGAIEGARIVWAGYLTKRRRDAKHA